MDKQHSKVMLVAGSKISTFEQRFATYFGQTQPAITCSMLTIETLEQGVKDVQS